MRVRIEILITIAARFGATAFSALGAIVAAWSLGSAGVGLFGLVRAVPAILQLFTEGGISAANSYLVNRRKLDPQAVFSNAVAWGLCIGLLDLVLWTCASGFLEHRVMRGLSMTGVLWAGLIAPLGVLQEQFDETLRAGQQYRFANLTKVVTELGTLGALLAFYMSGNLTMESLVTSFLIGRLVALIIGAARLRSLGFSMRPRFDRALLAEAAKFGVKAQLGDAINILNYRLDHLILAALTNASVVGVYVVASKCAEVFRFLPGAVRFVLEPRIAQSSRKDSRSTIWRLFWAVFALNTGIMLVAFVIGPYLIPVFFDQWSEDAIRPFHILLLGLCIAGGTGVISSYNLGHGQPHYNLYSVAVGLVATITLDMLLIPGLGVRGAALASSVAYAISAGVLLAIFVREKAEGSS